MSIMNDFGHGIVRDVRDEAAKQIALYLGGRYTDGHPVAKAWNQTPEGLPREVLAAALVRTIDCAISHFMSFLEFQIGTATCRCA
jgi:hypothetical protein